MGARSMPHQQGHGLEVPDGLKPASMYLYEASVTTDRDRLVDRLPVGRVDGRELAAIVAKENHTARGAQCAAP